MAEGRKTVPKEAILHALRRVGREIGRGKKHRGKNGETGQGCYESGALKKLETPGAMEKHPSNALRRWIL